MGLIGSNLLAMASRVIKTTTVKYYEYTSRTLLPNGLYDATYAAAVDVSGSLQAVPRNMYDKYGLDYQKEYWNFYVSRDVIDLGRDVAGDQIVVGSHKLQCESITAWIMIDGWNAVLCVKVGVAP